MARRASAFVQDLDELDALSDLPVPTAERGQLGLEQEGKTVPIERDAIKTVDGVPPEQIVGPSTPLSSEASVDTSPPLQDYSGAGLAQRPHESASSTTPPNAASTAGSEARLPALRTQVRLAPELAAWIAEVAARDEITIGSVIAAAALHPSAPDSPDGGARDSLTRVRRASSAGRNSTVPVTVSFTGAQREVVDVRAARWDCTRTDVVATVVRAAMVFTKKPVALQPTDRGAEEAS